MSSGGVNRTAVGGTSNRLMDTISTTGNQYNTQLQDILSGVRTSPLAGAGTEALSGFQEMAATGGYSPTQISAMKDEGSEAARSAYSTAADEYQRMSAATGGYGPSGSAATSLARKGSQAARKAAVDVDASIAQNQAQNRMQGMQGMSSLAGLSAAQTQQLLTTILGNRTETDRASNDLLATQLGIAKMPGTASYVNADVMQALFGG